MRRTWAQWLVMPICDNTVGERGGCSVASQERIKAQKDLGRVQREAANRLVLMEREKASNEAKSEFMR